LEDRHDWRRGIVRPPDSPSFRWMLFDVLATVVVVSGIFGEAGATGKVSSINSQLRSKTSELRAKSDQLLSLITLEAGSAATSAKNAQGSADKIGAQATGLRVQAEHLATELTTQQERADDAARSLEEEERKRLDLAISLLPRNFWDQSGALNKLSRVKPVPVVFEYVDEREPREMAEQIAFVLNALHWQYRKLPKGRYDSIREGITIDAGIKISRDNTFVSFGQREDTEKTGEAISSVLNSSGIEAGIGSISSAVGLPPTELIISVGRKPNRVLEQSLKELGGVPTATPLGGPNGNTLGGNRIEIPEPTP
jgi:hypothetical protein